MHDIEPYYNWRHLYMAEKDNRSPFYGRRYSEFEFSQTVYNYFIHPQWDFFGSRTLYMKILFVDYEQKFTIIELMGEWNDAIENDIMTLRREITDKLQQEGIDKFILIGENILNFHSSDDSYYEDWWQNVSEKGGWITLIDFPTSSQHDFIKARLQNYIHLLEYPNWRSIQPQYLYTAIDNLIIKSLE